MIWRIRLFFIFLTKENQRFSGRQLLLLFPQPLFPAGGGGGEGRGPLFFGDADKIPRITLKDYTRCLILRMRGVPSLDATAMNELEALLKLCQKNGVRLILSHVNPQPLQAMKKAGFYDAVGADNFCAHIDDALKAAAE